ncbi:hypothetical protein [uncultured Brevundimonas sp.]|uniref:hypothetical protein n=1 Tax=uncultured Brevundimonas sp. TaxID=213418 RepID=UPI0030EC98BE|tara:strand:- start:36279 stop:36458 length:180 start_codon:yes stop_codon:yes gene_type:complete
MTRKQTVLAIFWIGFLALIALWAMILMRAFSTSDWQAILLIPVAFAAFWFVRRRGLKRR